MWVSKSIHRLVRFRRRTFLFLAAIGPGIITMIADNDAGGISTYAQTGAKTGFSLLWAFIILVPMAYYVQEMTVRLGAVTKRGHAEAIFDGFGRFWGWFSIFDLALINWLTLVTEYIGMTQAMRLFNIPEWITLVAVTLLLLGIVITGRYWTFEKITFFFCLFNLVYIPAAIWAMNTGNVAEGWSAVAKGFVSPNFHFGETFTPVALLTLVMANIGTTITPWQIFFQQSAVVDKGMDVADIRAGKIDTFVGSLMTCVVAAFIIIATAGVFHFNPDPDPKWRSIDSAAQTAAAMPEVMPNAHWGQWAKILFAIGLFDAGLLGALCISLAT
ncbi:MAG: divalent metal cation transporter, partial [Verrucomicrobia bacterium]|nr:divalent metal cation transporter [Verrucomicrobiota bacterium]